MVAFFPVFGFFVFFLPLFFLVYSTFSRAETDPNGTCGAENGRKHRFFTPSSRKHHLASRNSRGCRGFILFHPQGLVLCRACALGSFEEEIQRRDGLVIVSAGIIRASVHFFVWRWARGVLTCSFLRVDIRLQREGGGWVWKKQSCSDCFTLLICANVQHQNNN